jgi:hypothetical protein
MENLLNNLHLNGQMTLTDNFKTQLKVIVYYIMRYGRSDEISFVLEIKVNNKKEYLAYHYSVNKFGEDVAPHLFIVKNDGKLNFLKYEYETTINEIILYLRNKYDKDLLV